MSAPAAARMTSDEFIAWSMEQPDGRRYELAAGQVIEMSAERSAHALVKAHIWRRLTEAVEVARLPCDVYPDGMAVEIDAGTVYEPDVAVRCGPRLPDDAVKMTDPATVVEVLSPPTPARCGRQTGGLFPPAVDPALPDRPHRGPDNHPPCPERGWNDPDPDRARRAD